jgi:hypothetical protein
MTLLRRYLILQALMLWQGGFVFYSIVVVPTGTAVLGSAAAQGAITARVVDALHLLGVVTLTLFAWDLFVAASKNRHYLPTRWYCWTIAVVAHGLLWYLHMLLTSFMDPERRYVRIHPPFYPVHRLYLWTCTIQWLALSLLSFLTLLAWKYQDHLSYKENPQ